MAYYGSWKIDDVLTFHCATHSASTANEADADALPTYRVYEDVTDAPLLTGSMAKLDDSNTIGFYAKQITLSAANGFENGKTYCVKINGVVSTISANLLHTWQMEAAVNANSLSVAAIASMFNALTSGMTTAGSIGKKLADWVILTSTTTADAIWNATATSYNTAGTMGNKLNSAASSGDPWTTAIPGAYAVGSAGHRLGNVPDITAGSNGGMFIAGTNATTTVNITGNLSGSVANVTDLSSTPQVELAAVPASTATIKDMIKWIFLLSRNKTTQTSSQQQALANDGATPVGTSAVSDNGTTAVRGQFS